VRNIHRSSRQERGFGRDATLDDVARAAMSSAAEENDVGREYIVVDDRRQRRRRRRRRAFNQHERHTAESDGPSCSLDPAIHQTLPLLRLSVRNNVVRRRRGKSVATWSVSRSVGRSTNNLPASNSRRFSAVHQGVFQIHHSPRTFAVRHNSTTATLAMTAIYIKKVKVARTRLPSVGFRS